MFEELKNKLINFNQEHLFQFLDDLNDEQKNLLIDDIQSIDLEEVCQIFNEVSEDANQDKLESVLEPLNDQVYQSTKDLSNEKKDYFRTIGKYNNCTTIDVEASFMTI